MLLELLWSFQLERCTVIHGQGQCFESKWYALETLL